MNAGYSRHCIFEGYVWVIISLFLPRVDNFGMIFACFVGLARWKIKVVYCTCCGAGDDLSLASDCCLDKHLIVKSLLIRSLKRVWSCLK